MVRYKVELIIDVRGTDKDDVIDYVEGAVRSMGGCHHPDDPFFGLTEDEVWVTSCKKVEMEVEDGGKA